MELKPSKSVADMYFAAALLAYGLRPERIDRTNPKRQRFIFDASRPVEVGLWITIGVPLSVKFDELTLDEIETHYISRTLWLPGVYVDKIKEIKSLIIHAHE